VRWLPPLHFFTQHTHSPLVVKPLRYPLTFLFWQVMTYYLLLPLFSFLTTASMWKRSSLFLLAAAASLVCAFDINDKNNVVV
jgi:hypothetical protein